MDPIKEAIEAVEREAFTVVYRNPTTEEVQQIMGHEKAVWFGWCHAPHERNEARAALAAQPAGVQVPPGLKERCAEILEWQRTGVLTGRALRDFAESKYPNDPHALQMAEADTAREAYRALTAAPEAPATAVVQVPKARILMSLLGAALGALRYHAEQTRPIERTRETIAAIERTLADAAAPEAPAQADEGDVVVCWDHDRTRILAVTRQNVEGQILKVIAEAPTQAEAPSEQAKAIMEQAQVFASAWSLVGGRFDSGSGLKDAEREKAELERMVRAALASQPQAEAVPVALTGEQRIYLAQAWAMLEEYAEWCRKTGHDSIAAGADASAHVIKEMLVHPPTQASQPQAVDAEDAARYRWLRDNATVICEDSRWSLALPGPYNDGDEDAPLDAAIDAARRAGGAA